MAISSNRHPAWDPAYICAQVSVDLSVCPSVCLASLVYLFFYETFCLSDGLYYEKKMKKSLPTFDRKILDDVFVV